MPPSPTFEMPLSLVLTIGGGLVTAVVFMFRLVITANDRRVIAIESAQAATLAHHESFVAKAQQDRADSAAVITRLDAQAQADRDRYTTRLEQLVSSVAADRNALLEKMTAEVECLIKEVPGIMVVKLVELGIIKTPAAKPKPKPKPKGERKTG